MLTELRIKNFAIIDQLALNFEAGLITFTGETGAGKSIILDALDTLLGSRADSTFVRSGVEYALVEATFTVPPAVSQPVHAILTQEELLDDPKSVMLGREIRRDSRNIARVNGRIVNVSVLRAIGQHLVDLHGQSEHLSLLNVHQHLQLLDRYTDIKESSDQYKTSYRQWSADQRELKSLRKREQETAQRIDLLTYQVAEIEAAKRNLPERIFQQEYMAEFLEDAGQVFRRVIDATTAEPRESGDGVSVGVDWGKHEDFTVISVVDRDGRMVGWERFNQIDYTVQLGRLEAVIDRYAPSQIVAESNSMGEPLVEQLQRRYGNVTGFKTTNQSKATLIEDLALAFERGEVAIFNEPVLVNELQAFEMSRLPSGMIRYAAPQGMHDDTVISLALAWHGLKRLRPAVLERTSNPFYG